MLSEERYAPQAPDVAPPNHQNSKNLSLQVSESLQKLDKVLKSDVLQHDGDLL